MRFLVVGEDKRQRCLTQLLQKEHAVCVYGQTACAKQADAIVLPCPSFDKAGALRAACTLDDLRPFLTEQTVLFCCGTPPTLDLRFADLLADETAVLENARLTAEAALFAVTERTGDSLHAKRCLTVGYGRIGTCLTRLLAAMGAECTVYARRAESRALASNFGHRTAAPGSGTLPAFDFVFNTVPAQALSRPQLFSLPETCLWVELASFPGGLPQDGEVPFSVLPAGGLPGQYLPAAAARVLYDAIFRQTAR